MSSGGVRGGRVSDIDEVQIDMGQFGMAVGGAGVGYSDTEAGGGEGSEESDPEELWVSYASRPMQNSAGMFDRVHVKSFWHGVSKLVIAWRPVV